MMFIQRLVLLGLLLVSSYISAQTTYGASGTGQITLGGPLSRTYNVSPSTLTFANEAVKTTTASQRVTVTNTGLGILSLGTSAFTVTRDFTISATSCTNASNTSIAGTCTIDNTLTPSKSGTRSGTGAISPTNGIPASFAVRRSGTGMSGSGNVSLLQMPRLWVNPLPGQSLSAFHPTPGRTEQLGWGTNDHAETCAGLTAAYNDWTADADITYLVVMNNNSNSAPILSGTSPCLDWSPKVVKANADKRPTGWFIVQSRTPLPEGQTVCSHDFKTTSSRNPTCTNDVGSMWTIEINGLKNPWGIGLMQTDVNGNGVNHVIFRDMELRVQAGLGTVFTSLIRTGDGNQTAYKGWAHEIGFDRVWIHGDRDDCPGRVCGGANNVTQVIYLLQCYDCWISNSQVSRIYSSGSESHAVACLGCKQVKVVNSWFEGPSIGMMCGGAAIPTIAAQNCEDMEIRKNRWTYPTRWLNITERRDAARKNPWEFKSCVRCVVTGNIFENVDPSGGQAAKLINYKAIQYYPNGYQVTSSDDYIAYNIFRTGCASGSILGKDDPLQNFQSGVGRAMNRLAFYGNLIYDQNNSWCTTGWQLLFGSNGSTWSSCTVTRNSAGTQSTITCPAGGLGQTSTSIYPGDWFYATTFADTTFNVPFGSPVPAAAETDPTSMSVTYANPGTPNASSSGGSLYDYPGWPANLWIQHNTFIASGGSTTIYGLTDGQDGTSYPMQRYSTITDNFFGHQNIGGIKVGSKTEGTASQQSMFDMSTLVFHHNVFVGGNAAGYSEVDTVSGAQISPVVNGWFSITDNCPTRTPTTGCWGMIGAMNTANTNNALSDWHNYRLCHATDAVCNNTPSAYSAGQSRQASDNKDIGFDPALIDAAQTATGFTCLNSCGSGPGQD